MAKIPRSKEEIEVIRDKILTAALDIITREGYENLSMRNIAKRTGMTAANIYNYFSSKDELYLTLLKKAFEKLATSIKAITKTDSSPLENLIKIGEAYINFAINNKNYYEVMLMTTAPRYSDFVGSDLEEVAYKGKETGLAVFNYVLDIVIEAFKGVPRKEARLYLLKLWSTLHGIVSLYNYGILPEIDHQPLVTLNKTKELAFQQFMNDMKTIKKKENLKS